MTSYTTRTREFGEVTFSAPAATETTTGYVWIDTGRGERRQICYGGDFVGSAARATTLDLKATAQQWLRARRDYMRREGISTVAKATWAAMCGGGAATYAAVDARATWAARAAAWATWAADAATSAAGAAEAAAAARDVRAARVAARDDLNARVYRAFAEDAA